VNISPNTLLVGKVCHLIDTVDSTQTFLKNLYANSRPIDGTVILSYNQTSGYGQRKSTWQGQSGMNIALSCLFLPAFLSAKDHFFLTMAVALAVKSTLRNLTGKAIYIKWPNDIIVDDLKIAGILIETNLQQSSINTVFAGIGLNVKQKDFGVLKNKATSMELATNNSYDLDQVARVLMEWLDKYYLQLKSGKYDDLLGEYNNSLYLRDQHVNLQDSKGLTRSVLFKGVERDGKVSVMIGEKSESFIHGVVRILYSG